MAEQPIIEIVLPTYRMEPDESERFYPSVAKALAEEILCSELKDQQFEEEDMKDLSTLISDKVRISVCEKIKGTRYKIIVQTVIGQLQDQGIRVASRCLWDPTTDNYCSAIFTNATIYCNVLIFALYTD